MEVTSPAILLSWLIFPFGQLLKINIFSQNIALLDLCLLGIVILSFKNIKIQKIWLIFLGLNLLTFSLGSINYGLHIKSIFYLFRLICFVLLLNLNIKKWPTFQLISIWSFLIFGFVQYLFWPDLTYFSAINRDPHLNRLVGSLLDPTFTALIFLLFLLEQFFQKKPQPILIALLYLGIALSYSRSTLLALVVCSLVYAIKKNNLKTFFLCVFLVFLTYLALPKPPGEGTNLNRTNSIKAKIENYQEALNLIKKHPLTGVGYNYLWAVRNINAQNLSTFGFDNSLLTITSTSGIMGAMIFTLGLKKRIEKLPTKGKLLWLAILIHSLFANSLLYPWVYWILLNLEKD